MCTAGRNVTWWAAIASAMPCGSTSHRHDAQPCVSGKIMQTVAANVWNIGRCKEHVLARLEVQRLADALDVDARLRCVSIAPSGCPVVPEA